VTRSEALVCNFYVVRAIDVVNFVIVVNGNFCWPIFHTHHRLGSLGFKFGHQQINETSEISGLFWVSRDHESLIRGSFRLWRFINHLLTYLLTYLLT